jgi:hypothetical protein
LPATVDDAREALPEEWHPILAPSTRIARAGSGRGRTLAREGSKAEMMAAGGGDCMPDGEGDRSPVNGEHPSLYVV